MFEENNNGLMTADELRAITKTEKELYTDRLESMKESIMSTMVKVAGAGKSEYEVGIAMNSFVTEGMGETLVSDLKAAFTEQGYKVSTETMTLPPEELEKNPKQKPSVKLTVNWSNN